MPVASSGGEEGYLNTESYDEASMTLLADANLLTHEATLECILCLDDFDQENPMIPTLCACGESKAHFHLACLFAWLEKSKTCPYCRAELFYQEMIA